MPCVCPGVIQSKYSIGLGETRKFWLIKQVQHLLELGQVW